MLYYHFDVFLSQSKAVLAMLSLGQFVRVAEILYGMRYFDRAARFIEACLEFGLIDKSEENGILFLCIWKANFFWWNLFCIFEFMREKEKLLISEQIQSAWAVEYINCISAEG